MAPHGVFILPLRRHPPGHANSRYCATVADLSSAASGSAGLRVDRRVLPGFGEHDAWIEFGRPQPSGAVRALQGVAVAGAVESQITVSFAANACRPAHS